VVRVHYAAVNPADRQFRYGYYREFAPRTMPFILGWDLAGTVEQVGESVAAWSRGDRVFAMADMSRDGAYAEYIAIRADNIRRVPATMTLQQAAMVSLAALTAWKALFEDGGLQR
jgi:NADPH:quinone reductase-like Zn-dependent oxidoreductase